MSFFSVLDKATLENLAADPASVSGRMYLNTSTGAKWYDGAAWRVAATLDSAQTLTNKSLTAPVLTSYGDFTEVSSPANPSAGFQRMYAKSDGKIYKRNSAGVEAELGAGAGSDQSFQLDAVAANVLTLKGGYKNLNDGRELATYNGSTYGSDITVALLTLFAAPIDNTTYWLYIDIDALGAEVTQSLTGRKLYAIQQAQLVLSATKPESINRARYVPLGTVMGEAGNTYENTNFTTYAAKNHSNTPVAVNPKVYSISQAVGSVGSASQIQAGHLLAAASFPSDIGATKYSFFNLAADANDDNTGNAKNLTNNGSTAFTGTNIFGGSNLAANLDGTDDNFSSTDAFFNPGNGKSWAVGGWVKATDWTPGATDVIFSNLSTSSERGFSAEINSSGGIEFVATNTASNWDAAISVPSPGFVDGSWHHIVMLYDFPAKTLKAFIDGKLVGSSYLANTRTVSPSAFRIGAAQTTPTAFLTGAVEDCFFVNDYLLKDSDIRKLYASKLTHNANVSAANQDWRFVLGSGVQKSPSWQPVVDQSDANVLYADFSDLGSTETVDAALLDLGMSPVVVPAVAPFDQTYTSNPSFPISHGLSEVPSLQVGYKDASNDWHWTTGEGAVKADSTQLKGSIQTYFDAAATHVRIRAVVGASPTGVKDHVPAVSAGLVAKEGVIGRTNGVAVPSSYVGEIISATPTTQATVGYNTTAECASLSLSAGVWLITATISGSMGTRPTGSGAVGLGFDIYNSTAAAVLVEQKYIGYWGSTSNDVDTVYAPGALATTVNLSAAAVIKLRVRCDEASAGTGSPETSSRAGGKFQAIRIA